MRSKKNKTGETMTEVKAPSLSEREPAATVSEVSPKEENEAKQAKAMAQVERAVFSIPGISAKRKFEIIKVVGSNWGASKSQIMSAIASIHGIDATKRKTIEKVLEKEI